MKANRFTKDDKAYTDLVPLVLAVIIVFAMLYVGAYLTGVLGEELRDTLPAAPTSRDVIDNMTLTRLNNTSANFDDALNIVQVTVIITVLATAIGAIFLFTKFR